MSWQQFKHAWLIKFWAPIPAVIAAGILSTYYFGITGTFWAVTGEFTRWGGQLLQLFGVHAEEWGYFKIIHLEGSPLTRIDGMMILGMFGGCFAAALRVPFFFPEDAEGDFFFAADADEVFFLFCVCAIKRPLNYP